MEIAKLLEIPVEDVIKQIAEDKKASRAKANTLMGWAAISALSTMLYFGDTSTSWAASLLAKALHLHKLLISPKTKRFATVIAA